MKRQFAIGLGFSSECNMNCPFCYSKSKRQKGEDVDIRLWYDFFQRNAEYINSINYGTGENTTSTDWYKLIEHIRNRYPHIRQALTTNGYLSHVMKTDEKKREVVLHAIDEVDVSLDFGDASIHNAYRGNASAFGWANDTLAFCRDNGILPTIVTLGIDDTLRIDNMERIFEIAGAYDAKVRINLYRPVDKQSHVKPASLTSILTFFDWVNEHHTILSISDPLFSALLSTEVPSADPSGFSSLRVTQDGDIYPSTYLLYDDFLMGNIKDFSMVADLSDNAGMEALHKACIPEECKKCKHVEYCRGGVFDRRYIWYGSFEKRDPYCFVEKSELCRKYIQKKDRCISVHDGYLPTLFFQNGGNKEND